MPSFTTVNKVDANNFICKYEVFATKEEADARIVELHKISGYEDDFVVDNEATSVNGEMCFQTPKHFPVNKANKTVSFDQSAFDTDNNAYIGEDCDNRVSCCIEQFKHVCFLTCSSTIL